MEMSNPVFTFEPEIPVMGKTAVPCWFIIPLTYYISIIAYFTVNPSPKSRQKMGMSGLI
jgi:hypothetical protein